MTGQLDAQVRKAVIFKDSRAGVSKGCGLVTMATKEAAEAAMTAIDGKLQMPVRLPQQP